MVQQSKDHVWCINWRYGRAEVRAKGGMLGPVWFRLDDGHEFQPMHKLCRAAAAEQDPRRFLELTREIVRMLAEKERRLAKTKTAA